MPTPTELLPATLKRLVGILVTYAGIDTKEERLGFLEDAGLGSLQATIPIEANNKNFAQTLIRECRRVGQLPPTNKPAFDLLLEHLEEVVSGHPDEVAFLRSLKSPDTYPYDFDNPSPELEKQLAHYLAKMIEWHGTTRILGRPDPVPLDNIFTDVYIWDKPEATRYFTIEQLEASIQEDERHKLQERHDGIKVFEQFKRLFILGKPGAGKTTFMRWVTILAAKRKLEGIPIFITLKEMADAHRTVWEQILYQLKLSDIPNLEAFAKTILKSGNAIVLFDGLDEVPGEDEQQEIVITDIRDFVRQYSTNHYLITCRTAALTYVFNEFNYVEVANFTQEQIRMYVTRYFEIDKRKALFCLQELEKEHHQKLKDLATSPLLLSLFCLNYQENGSFPIERVDLYEEALLALLKRWDGQRNLRPKSPSIYGQLSPKRRTQLYSILGYENFKQGKSFIRTKALNLQVEAFLQTIPNISETDLSVANVLRDMEAQHGIIVERARQIHAFSHLTFQEYYTAKYIVDNHTSGTLDELMTHITDSRWRETLLLTSSLLSQTDSFFEKFFTRLDQIVSEIPVLGALLEHSNRRRNYYATLKAVDARWWVIYFTLAGARVFSRDHNLALALTHAHSLDYILSLNRSLDRVLENALALDRASALNEAREYTANQAYNFALSQSRKFDRNIALDFEFEKMLDLSCAFTRDYARSLIRALKFEDPAIRLDILFLVLGVTNWLADSLPHFIAMAIETSEQMALLYLANAFTNVKLPRYDDLSGKSKEWEIFRQSIMTLASEHWEISLKWQITKEVANQIKDYFYANKVLIESLKLAIVSNREGIKNRLLLPPGAAPT